MTALKSAFEAMGLRSVKTILASGNVVFEAPGAARQLDRRIAQGLEAALGFPVAVIIRTVRELRAMVASDPFKGIKADPLVRLYVTFLAVKRPGLSSLEPPSSARGVRIVRADPGEIYSLVRLSPDVGTTDLMRFLEKALGREVTTRNWGTVLKIAG